ncbi:glycoside hydrolase family 57 protein [Rhodococcus sp. D2-41]|nr:glycoside hydrolase family 57 protein [Rhodococcus sp. D2-41]
MFALVLHSHLPWLANHGRWPVGEEWLYQSWAASYLPVVAALRRLSAEGRTGMLTLGITPVLAAQLDDPHCLAGMHHWLGNWQLRAHEAALIPLGAGAPGTASSTEALHELGWREHRYAAAALDEFERHWRHGASPVLRPLIEGGAIELLGGPLAHPFQPLLDPRLRGFSLREGLADAKMRWGHRPPGIWAPECAFTPGMEHGYAAAGVSHFMVDGPSLHGDTSLGRPVGDTDVVAFGRDLQVSYRVWSPKSGYPGDGAYRDFHTYDHDTGLKPARVTGRTVASPDKAPYDPDKAAAAVDRHVADFVEVVRERLRSESARIGRDALVVAAFDTELFGHWWHEGPQWLEKVLRALPQAGIRVGTLADARREGYVGEPVDLPASSWGSGKDWRVWAGDQVADLVQLNSEVVATALDGVDKSRAGERRAVRDITNDQILREALMAVASDWAFMVSKDTAAAYARDRAHKHAHAMREIEAASAAGHTDRARRLALGWLAADGLFPGLDARRLPPRGWDEGVREQAAQAGARA